MKLATVSSQRQITIPLQILEKLDISVKDKLLLRVEGNKLIAEPVTQSLVDELVGSWKQMVPISKIGKSWKEIMKVTKKNTAQKLANE